MSAEPVSPPDEFPVDIGPPGTGNIYALDGAYVSAPIGDATDISEADTEVDRIITNAEQTMSDEQAAVIRSSFRLVQGAMDDGEITPKQFSQFFHWLYYSRGAAVLTAALVAGGGLEKLLGQYVQLYGKPKPGTTAKPASASTPAPTKGQTAVAKVAINVQGQLVNAPGLTKAEASAISKAIGISYRDTLKVMAALQDMMLPGMGPGQVPLELDDLTSAVAVIETELTALAKQVRPGAPASLSGKVSGIGAQVSTLTKEVTTLREQLAGTAKSTLGDEISGLHKSLQKTASNVLSISHKLPGLATVAALGDLAAKVDVTVEQLDLKHSSALDTALNGVEHSVADLRRMADDAEECCATNADNIASTVKALGGKSLLSTLGRLAGDAFGIFFLLGIVDTLVAVVDMPAVLATTVIDTETMSTWAANAAGIMERDQSWLGKLA